MLNLFVYSCLDLCNCFWQEHSLGPKYTSYCFTTETYDIRLYYCIGVAKFYHLVKRVTAISIYYNGVCLPM